MRGGSWTVEQWAALSAAEQDAVFQARVVTDLSQVPADYLAEVRAQFEARIAQRGMPDAHDDRGPVALRSEDRE